jgi:parvulin-like peptidyl-prolyl isomerase
MGRYDFKASGAPPAGEAPRDPKSHHLTALSFPAARVRSRSLLPLACALPLLVCVALGGATPNVGQQSEGRGTRQQPASREESPEAAPVATVDGEQISLERFNRLYQARISPARLKRGGILQAAALRVKAEVAQQLIDEMLIEKAAARRGIAIPPEELDAAWRHSENTLADAELSRSNYTRIYGTVEEAHTALRVRLLAERLAGVSDDDISDEQARALYEQNPSLYHAPAHLTAQAVVFLVAPGAAAASEGAQRRRAEEFRDLARQRDASFYLLGRRYAGDPAVRVEGFIDRVTEQTVPAALWDALTRAELEQVTEPVRTPEGFTVFKLLRRNPAFDKSFEQVREEIKASLRESIRAAKVGELLRGLRAEVRIENLLLARYPSAEVHTRGAAVRLEGGIIAPETIPRVLPRGPGASAHASVQIPENR